MSHATPVSLTKSSIVARPSSERYIPAVLHIIIVTQCMAALMCPLASYIQGSFQLSVESNQAITLVLVFLRFEIG